MNRGFDKQKIKKAEVEAEPVKADAEVVVPAASEGVSKKVKLDLEVDTSVKDSFRSNPMLRSYTWHEQ